MPSIDDILSLVPPKANFRVTYGSDPNQFIDLRLPKGKGPHAVALGLHGGYWRAKYNLEYFGHLCAALTAKGIATANVEYRRVGNPGGGWPGTFEDIRRAYQFIEQNAARHSLDANRLFVIGHSAGGQLALCLAARESSIKAAISLAGVIDLQQAYDLHLSDDAVAEFLGGRPSEVPDHYREADPMKLAIHTRQELIHGSADDTVPPSFSSEYVKSKTEKNWKENAHLVSIPNAGHFEVVDPRSAAWTVVEKTVAAAIA